MTEKTIYVDKNSMQEAQYDSLGVLDPLQSAARSTYLELSNVPEASFPFTQFLGKAAKGLSPHAKVFQALTQNVCQLETIQAFMWGSDDVSEDDTYDTDAIGKANLQLFSSHFSTLGIEASDTALIECMTHPSMEDLLKEYFGNKRMDLVAVIAGLQQEYWKILYGSKIQEEAEALLVRYIPGRIMASPNILVTCISKVGDKLEGFWNPLEGGGHFVQIGAPYHDVMNHALYRSMPLKASQGISAEQFLSYVHEVVGHADFYELLPADEAYKVFDPRIKTEKGNYTDRLLDTLTEGYALFVEQEIIKTILCDRSAKANFQAQAKSFKHRREVRLAELKKGHSYRSYPDGSSLMDRLALEIQRPEASLAEKILVFKKFFDTVDLPKTANYMYGDIFYENCVENPFVYLPKK